MAKEKFDGAKGDDILKYGTSGRFPEVLGTLNPQFLPGEPLNATKHAWDKYVAGLMGGAAKHVFGGFAAYLLKDMLGSSTDYPGRQEWLNDCTTYNGSPIDPVAFKAMGDALRDNLQKANPAPMFFAVKATNTGKHFVTQVAGDVGGKPGILVTMNCPADSGDS